MSMTHQERLVAEQVMYMRWQGDEGMAADSNTLEGEYTAAGVWPFFDFVQGPTLESTGFKLDFIGSNRSRW